MVVRKILEGILASGSTSISFTDTDLPNSLIRVYSTDPDLMPVEQSLSGNTLTITYEPQDISKGIAVEMVKQGLDIVDDLESEDATKALSANQGYVLKCLIDDIVIPTVPENITDLDDVSVTDIENGQVLAWNSITEKFENVNQSGGTSLTVIHKNWTATSNSASGTALTESATLEAGNYIITAHSPLAGTTSFLPCCLKIDDALYTGCIQNITAQYGLYFCILNLAQSSSVVFSSAGALSVTWDSQYLDRGGMDIIKIS